MMVQYAVIPTTKLGFYSKAIYFMFLCPSTTNLCVELMPLQTLVSERLLVWLRKSVGVHYSGSTARENKPHSQEVRDCVWSLNFESRYTFSFLLERKRE